MVQIEQQTRERLLATAIEQFGLHGYDHATVRDICRQAGANVNAVSYYFEDKQGLYVEAVKTAHRAIRQGQGPVAIDEIADRLEAGVGRGVSRIRDGHRIEVIRIDAGFRSPLHQPGMRSAFP